MWPTLREELRMSLKRSLRTWNPLLGVRWLSCYILLALTDASETKLQSLYTWGLFDLGIIGGPIHTREPVMTVTQTRDVVKRPSSLWTILASRILYYIILLYYIIFYYIILFHFILCYIILYYIICHITLDHAILYYIISLLCYTILLYITFYYII